MSEKKSMSQICSDCDDYLKCPMSKTHMSSRCKTMIAELKKQSIEEIKKSVTLGAKLLELINEASKIDPLLCLARSLYKEGYTEESLVRQMKVEQRSDDFINNPHVKAVIHHLRDLSVSEGL